MSSDRYARITSSRLRSEIRSPPKPSVSRARRTLAGATVGAPLPPTITAGRDTTTPPLADRPRTGPEPGGFDGRGTALAGGVGVRGGGIDGRAAGVGVRAGIDGIGRTGVGARGGCAIGWLGVGVRGATGVDGVGTRELTGVGRPVPPGIPEPPGIVCLADGTVGGAGGSGGIDFTGVGRGIGGRWTM